MMMRFWLKSRAWGLRGRNPAFEHLENNVPPSPDEMILETITPTQRGNTLDPEVRNSALQGRGRVIYLMVRYAEAVCVYCLTMHAVSILVALLTYRVIVGALT
jgi:hypothetical protein